MSGARGEAFIEFEGEQLPILLTNRALAEVEAATGASVLEIAKGVQSNEISMNVAGHLLRAGIEYGRRDAHTGGRPYQLSKAWDIMDTLGFIHIARVVLTAFAEVLSYEGEESKGEELDRPT